MLGLSRGEQGSRQGVAHRMLRRVWRAWCGGFATSGGSAKNPRISADEGTIVRVKGVPETIYSKIKDHEGVKLVSDIDVESLKAEREKLLKRIAEIDGLLAL